MALNLKNKLISVTTDSIKNNKHSMYFKITIITITINLCWINPYKSTFFIRAFH